MLGKVGARAQTLAAAQTSVRVAITYSALQLSQPRHSITTPRLLAHNLPLRRTEPRSL